MFHCSKCQKEHARPVGKKCLKSAGESHVSLLPNTSQGQSQYDIVSHGTDTELASSQSVIPSITYLRNNESVQTKVEKRLAELKNLNETATIGRIKSQRGGPGEVFVKKLVDWPQHFILTGTHKTRLSYDDLTITQ